MHPGQLSVTTPMVRRLVAEQFPRGRNLEIRPVRGPGTVNAIFRIGGQYVARFPLQPDRLATVRRRLRDEAAAAGELAGKTPFATPRPIAVCEPGAGYPLAWSIFTWLPGVTASADDCSQSCSFATDLGDFISSVRAIDTAGRVFTGGGRGGILAAHDQWMRHCLGKSAGLLDVDVLSAIWREMRQIPRGDSPDLMNHSDLIPPNMLVADGRLTGVLDVGGLRAADPALDLVAAWHVLDAERRTVLRSRLGCDEEEWQRGRAWAFEQSVGAVWYYADTNPVMSRDCRRTLERIVADIGV